MYYGSYDAKMCLWYDLWLHEKGLVWGYQDQFTHTATTFSSDSFWYYKLHFQPVQNINTMVLHLISHIGVICYTNSVPRPQNLHCLMLLHVKPEFQELDNSKPELSQDVLWCY